MQASLSYVCFSCNQIMERAPRGECSYCGSDRIVSVTSLMHERGAVDRMNNPQRKLLVVAINHGRRPLAERI